MTTGRPFREQASAVAQAMELFPTPPFPVKKRADFFRQEARYSDPVIASGCITLLVHDNFLWGLLWGESGVDESVDAIRKEQGCLTAIVSAA